MNDTHRPGTWRIGRLFGVDLLIRPSLLILGAVLVLVFAQRYENWTETNPYLLATIFVVSLYVSILVHEIAHLLLARSYGMRVESVTLHVLGGETLIAGQSRTPSQELLTSIAGPVASLAIGLASFAVSDALTPGSASDIIWSIGFVNILVAAFNMIPGLPLDGGRVFRAIIWMVTRNEETGIRVAAWIGRLTAIGLVIWAIATFRDAQDGALNLLIAAMVGLVLWQGATQALRSANRSARINLLVARDIALVGATPPLEAVPLPADLYGSELLRAMAARPAETYVLTETDGSVFGVLTARAVDDAYRASKK